MAKRNQVPSITISGNTASSNAKIAKNVADTCACWSPEEMKLGKTLGKQASGEEIYHIRNWTSNARRFYGSLRWNVHGFRRLFCVPCLRNVLILTRL